MKVEDIARLAHEVNKAYCECMGDNSQPTWDEAPEWQKKSAINGVKFHMLTEKTPEESHENWFKEKEKEGWKYGEVKDPVLKEHPCMMPYEDLPAEQKAKDYLFSTVVRACKFV